MKIGASSACFYPLETEKAFLNVAELGFECCEIFFNSSSELEKPFIRELRAVQDNYGTQVISFHPYRSFAEGYDLFSRYKRRYDDALESFKRYFEGMNTLGAKYLVLHGSKFGIDISAQEYAERYRGLDEVAESFGCKVAHENVVCFSGEKPEFMAFMKDRLGDSFKMVLDVKQARRSGVNVQDFIDIMGSNIVHVHLSDFTEEKDCVPPSEKGMFNFENLFRSLKNVGYEGRYIVELYSDSYTDKREILQSAEYLDKILKKV